MIELLLALCLGFLLGCIASHNTHDVRRVTEAATRCGESIERLGNALAGEGETWAGLFPRGAYDEVLWDLRELVAATKEIAGGDSGD